MIIAPNILETGVDKLANMVHTRGKIAVSDAAKELGVSRNVIMERVDILDQGLIDVQYKFLKPYLVTRKLTKAEVEQKSNEFNMKKEVVIRKAECNLNLL